jgi:hypothetical protein
LDPVHQQAFDNVKAAIAKETVLAYLDLSKPFEIYRDASATQLGAVIAQDKANSVLQQETIQNATKIECHRK